jgi:hypothetical protein
MTRLWGFLRSLTWALILAGMLVYLLLDWVLPVLGVRVPPARVILLAACVYLTLTVGTALAAILYRPDQEENGHGG